VEEFDPGSQGEEQGTMVDINKANNPPAVVSYLHHWVSAGLFGLQLQRFVPKDVELEV